jgi:hypothetical protein
MAGAGANESSISPVGRMTRSSWARAVSQAVATHRELGFSCALARTERNATRHYCNAYLQEFVVYQFSHYLCDFGVPEVIILSTLPFNRKDDGDELQAPPKLSLIVTMLIFVITILYGCF